MLFAIFHRLINFPCPENRSKYTPLLASSICEIIVPPFMNHTVLSRYVSLKNMLVAACTRIDAVLNQQNFSVYRMANTV